MRGFFLNTATLAFLVLAASAPPVSAEAAPERTLLGLAGWELYQEGDPFFDPENAVVRATYVDAGMKFSIGCTRGSSVDVAWQPGRPLREGAAADSFSVNGRPVASRGFPEQVPGNAPPEPGWSLEGGAALDLVKAMREDWTGTVVISGGGVTDGIPFDEDRMGGVSELILFACGE
ncbi:MAG: hypothetical protein GC196_07565 [Hyphomonas sp.]|nr:hypothetical protein [Hyphomonas sp.]